MRPTLPTFPGWEKTLTPVFLLRITATILCSLQTCQIGITVPIVQMRKRGPREVESLAQSHTAGK